MSQRVSHLHLNRLAIVDAGPRDSDHLHTPHDLEGLHMTVHCSRRSDLYTLPLALAALSCGHVERMMVPLVLSVLSMLLFLSRQGYYREGIVVRSIKR
jgi:hypothetical protein